MQNVSIDFSIFTGGWNLSPLVFLRNCCLMSPLCAFLRHQHPSTRLLLVHIPKFCWFIFPIFFLHIPAEAPFSIADQTLKSTVATVVSCKDFPAQAACCGHFWKCTGSLAGSDWRVYSTPRKNKHIGFYFFFFPRFVSSKKRMFPCFSAFLLFPASLLLENKRFAIQHVANTVEVAASSSKMLQIARKTNRRGNARKSKRTITLLVIPTVTKFCHSFRHLIWKYIYGIYFLTFWHSILALYPASIQFWHSLWQWHCRTWISRLRSSSAHWDLELGRKEERRRKEGGRREEGGRKEGGRRKEVTLIKSRDPHLVWGKTKTEKTHQTIPDLFTFLCFWGCHQTIPNTWTAEAAAQRWPAWCLTVAFTTSTVPVFHPALRKQKRENGGGVDGSNQGFQPQTGFSGLQCWGFPRQDGNSGFKPSKLDSEHVPSIFPICFQLL